MYVSAKPFYPALAVYAYKHGTTYNTNLCERQVGGARSGFVSYNSFSYYIL